MKSCFFTHLRTVTADWHSCGRQRFWQSGDLSFPIFRWNPDGEGAGGYYEAISICQMERTITGFIEFMLEQIEIALDEIKKEPKEPVESLSKYVKKLLEAMEEDIPYTANEILELLHLKSKDAHEKKLSESGA